MSDMLTMMTLFLLAFIGVGLIFYETRSFWK
jgi:hypothetical protein